MPRFFGMVAAVYIFLTGAAYGQGGPCGPRDELLNALSAEFGEVITWRGLSSQGAVIEVTSAPSGTWTIVITRPDGRSCLAVHGEASEMPPRPITRGRPS